MIKPKCPVIEKAMEIFRDRIRKEEEQGFNEKKMLTEEEKKESERSKQLILLRLRSLLKKFQKKDIKRCQQNKNNMPFKSLNRQQNSNLQFHLLIFSQKILKK
jgi:hypothetical protein